MLGRENKHKEKSRKGSEELEKEEDPQASHTANYRVKRKERYIE